MGKALPKQVQDQIDEADRIAAEIEADQATPELQVVGDETTPVDGPATSPDKNLSFEAEQPEADEVIVAEGAEPTEPTEIPEVDNWEHKYKTLQGMYNREKNLVSELTGRVEAMQEMLAGLQAARENAAPEVPVEDATPSGLTEDEIKDYGPELIDVMKRTAREAVQGELTALRNENAELKAAVGSVGQSQAKTDLEKLYAGLGEAVPNWRQVNTHPDFLEWLKEPDVYSGVARSRMLKNAFGANDTGRVIQFFKGFLSENAALQPAADSNPQSVVENTPEPKVDLASLASPGQGSGGGADNINETGRLWKESEIGTFYEEARKGKFKGRKEEYDATEREIQNAMTQGRILVGQ
jgi:predicted nucleotidyltransferase